MYLKKKSDSSLVIVFLPLLFHTGPLLFFPSKLSRTFFGLMAQVSGFMGLIFKKCSITSINVSPKNEHYKMVDPLQNKNQFFLNKSILNLKTYISISRLMRVLLSKTTQRHLLMKAFLHHVN